MASLYSFISHLFIEANTHHRAVLPTDGHQTTAHFIVLVHSVFTRCSLCYLNLHLTITNFYVVNEQSTYLRQMWKSKLTLLQAHCLSLLDLGCKSQILNLESPTHWQPKEYPKSSWPGMFPNYPNMSWQDRNHCLILTIYRVSCEPHPPPTCRWQHKLSLFFKQHWVGYQQHCVSKNCLNCTLPSWTLIEEFGCKSLAWSDMCDGPCSITNMVTHWCPSPSLSPLPLSHPPSPS